MLATGKMPKTVLEEFIKFVGNNIWCKISKIIFKCNTVIRFIITTTYKKQTSKYNKN